MEFCCNQNGPNRCAYANTLGVALDWHSKLRVILVCGRSLSQRWSGNESAVPARMLRKCALKFLMATLVTRWHHFKLEFVFFFDVEFHFVQDLVAEDELLWCMLAASRRWTRTS